MVEMIHSASAPLLGPEFDGFLFAPIGEERNGMLLSVVSALARLSVDPWQEAASLAQLPRKTATRRLASLIAMLPDRPWTHLDPEANAARLIACLPHRVGSNAASSEASQSFTGPAVMQSQLVRYAAFTLLVLLGGLGIAASQQSAARVNNADAPASSTAIAPTSPPGSGQ
jgi:hypothetical protein